MNGLYAGVAQVDITPPIGVPTSGFAGRGPAECVRDNLRATFLALEFEGSRVGIASADILDVQSDYANGIRSGVSRRVGAHASAVFICCTHTHYGPAINDTAGGVAQHDLARAYRSQLAEKISRAAEQAFSDLKSVKIGVGRGACQIGINRRERTADGRVVLGNNPSGPCDRELIVLRFESKDGPLATFVNFACHPVCAGSRMRAISADYIAAMRGLVEPRTGAPCLFLQGAAGDINPIEMRHSHDPAQRLGNALGTEVLRVFESIEPNRCQSLSAVSKRIDLPAKRFESLEEGRHHVTDLKTELDRVQREGQDESSLYWTKSRFDRAEQMLTSLTTGKPLMPVSAELAAIRLGDIALAFAPGEVFNELGQSIKRESPIADTMFVGYTNGSIGYVPTNSSYPEGGYEVTHACRVAPEASKIVFETLLSLLRTLSER